MRTRITSDGSTPGRSDRAPGRGGSAARSRSAAKSSACGNGRWVVVGAVAGDPPADFGRIVLTQAAGRP
ncbi:hypothetical protein AB0J55_04685 [Amycolatopsis sp. NPDC049688]|uniref:hypothetical protein n=1 Tax=Amycolatopsis sp. NPDC049688 TaxID=3154733 RepID=UPI003433703E